MVAAGVASVAPRESPGFGGPEADYLWAGRQRSWGEIDLPSQSADIRGMTDRETREALDEVRRELGAEVEAPPPPLQLSGLQPRERARPGETQRLMVRITIYILGACVFVGAASFMKPERSVASAGPIREPAKLDVVVGVETGNKSPAAADEQTGPVAPERNAQGWPLVGSLHGPTHDVWAYASPEGPRYTVIDAMGNVVMEDAVADDVYRTVPEVDLKNMQLEPGAVGGPLMMAEDTGR